MSEASKNRLFLFAAALLFSTGGAAIKACSLSSWQIAGFRSGLAAAVLSTSLPEARPFGKTAWTGRTGLIGLAYAATMILFVLANKSTTSANAIFLQSTAPLYLLLLGPFVLREPIRGIDLAVTGTVAAGAILLLSGSEVAGTTAPDPARGNWMALAAGFTWALTITGLRWAAKRSGAGDSSAATVIAGNLIAFAVCLPLAVPVQALSVRDLAVLLYLGLFQVSLAYVLLTRSLRAVGGLEAATLLLLEPVFNPIWTWLVHGERPRPAALWGGFLIVGAVFAGTVWRLKFLKAGRFETLPARDKDKRIRRRSIFKGVLSTTAEPAEKLRTRLGHWTGFRNRDDQILIVLSLVIGLVVGLTVVAFILLTGRLAVRMYPPNSAAWRRVMVPTAGSLVSGYLLYRYFPNARGSGIPQAKFALFIRNGYISLRTVLGKFLCCSISLASGIALGREGPSVQIGAGIASVIGRRFGLSPANVKALVPVGCAAALAAAFNTPIAAVLFSLEEILGDMHAPVLGSVVLSSATSWMVLHLILGDQPLFHVPAYQLVHPLEFGIYVILGVVGGLGSVCFVKLLLKLRILFKRLPASTVWLQPAAGGLAVGLLGWWMPEVLGVGYDYVDRVLGGDVPVKTVAILAVMKIVATPLCYSSGNAGGIFGPSLFIGAMIGGATGGIAHSLLPGLTANPGAYALVGMGAAFAGIVRTPLTSVIMIFEMTRDYAIIVPLMISNLISFFISRQLQPEPIYEALALQEGVYLPTAESREELTGDRVNEVMRPVGEETPLLSIDSNLETVRHFLDDRQCNSWPVGERNFVTGLISRRDLDADSASRTMIDESNSATLRDLMDLHGKYPYVHTDHPVSFALERMREGGVDVLPVVSRASIHEICGVIGLREILAAYGVPEAALLSRNMPG